ncbi:hypothetical protein GCM10023317_16100 [Actinopolymorpha pittospori]
MPEPGDTGALKRNRLQLLCDLPRIGSALDHLDGDRGVDRLPGNRRLILQRHRTVHTPAVVEPAVQTEEEIRSSYRRRAGVEFDLDAAEGGFDHHHRQEVSCSGRH